MANINERAHQLKSVSIRTMGFSFQLILVYLGI